MRAHTGLALASAAAALALLAVAGAPGGTGEGDVGAGRLWSEYPIGTQPAAPAAPPPITTSPAVTAPRPSEAPALLTPPAAFEFPVGEPGSSTTAKVLTVYGLLGLILVWIFAVAAVRRRELRRAGVSFEGTVALRPRATQPARAPRTAPRHDLETAETASHAEGAQVRGEDEQAAESREVSGSESAYDLRAEARRLMATAQALLAESERYSRERREAAEAESEHIRQAAEREAERVLAAAHADAEAASHPEDAEAAPVTDLVQRIARSTGR